MCQTDDPRRKRSQALKKKKPKVEGRRLVEEQAGNNAFLGRPLHVPNSGFPVPNVCMSVHQARRPIMLRRGSKGDKKR